MHKHYNKEELDMYLHGEMSVLGKINCSTHLQSCTACRKKLLELKNDEVFLAEIRDSLKIYNELSGQSGE